MKHNNTFYQHRCSHSSRLNFWRSCQLTLAVNKLIIIKHHHILSSFYAFCNFWRTLQWLCLLMFDWCITVCSKKYLTFIQNREPIMQHFHCRRNMKNTVEHDFKCWSLIFIHTHTHTHPLMICFKKSFRMNIKWLHTVKRNAPRLLISLIFRQEHYICLCC